MADNNTENIKQSTQAQSEFNKRTLEGIEFAARLAEEGRNLTSELEDQLGIRRRLNDYDKALLDITRSISRSAQENNVELARSGKLSNEIAKAERISLDLKREIAILEATLGDELSEQVDNANKVAKINEERRRLSKEIAQQEKSITDEKGNINEKILEEVATLRNKRNGLDEELIETTKLLDEDGKRLAIAKDAEFLQRESIALKKAEEARQVKINQNLGLTGAILDNLNKAGLRAFGGLGLNLGTFQDSIKKTTEEAEKLAEKLEGDKGKGLTAFQKKLKVFQVTAIGASKALGSALLDPLTVAKMLTDQFTAIDKAAVELSRTTGQSFGALDGFTGRFATAVDLAEVITSETKQSGLNANNIFSKDVLAGAAEFKNLVGGSAEEIAGLLSLTAATGMSTDLIQESIVDTTSAFNGANRAAISQRQVLQDVLTTSNSIKASLAGNPTALAEAATAARRLGLSLSEVDSIASSLIDFESSITAELEAQLLTGRNLNLSKARELALSNDLAGLSNEIFKNQVSVAEFSQMNRIQQEGLAKALGMSRDQLANMAFQQAKLNGLTDEQAAAAAGVSLSDMQRASAMESLNKSLTSLLQIFAPIFDGLSKIVGLAAKFPLLSQGAIAATLAFKMLGNPLTATVGMFGKMYRGAAKFLGALKPKSISEIGTAFKGLGTKISSAFQGTDNIKKESDKVKEFQKVTSKAGKTAPAAGTGMRMFFTNLGIGLTSFAQAMAIPTPIGPVGAVAALALGALSAAMIGLGFALKLAAPGIKAFGTVITSVFQGVGHLITTTAEAIQNLMSTLTLGQIGTLAAAAASFFALGSSLAFLGTAGILALPVLMAVTPLLTGLNAAGDAGEAEGQNSMAKVEEKLDLLIQTVDKKRTIVINGKELEEVMVLR